MEFKKTMIVLSLTFSTIFLQGSYKGSHIRYDSDGNIIWGGGVGEEMAGDGGGSEEWCVGGGRGVDRWVGG